MSHVSSALQEHAEKNKISPAELSRQLGLNKSVVSRIFAGTQPIGAVTMGRIVMTLDAKTAQVLLQAYFEDDIVRIRTASQEKADQLGIKIAHADCQFSVHVALKRK